MYSLTARADPSSLLRASDASLPRGTEIRSRAGLRGLYATQHFSAGDAILYDRAFLCERRDGSLWVSPSFLPDDVDAALLSLAPTCATRDALPSVSPLRRELLAATLRVNSFGVGDDAAGGSSGAGGGGGGGGGAWAQLASGGVALYPRVSLANHACAPNARTVRAHEAAAAGAGSDADADADEPPVRLLEARTDIAAGDEITISYVPPTWAKSVRRARLRAAYDFECGCPRCAAPCDDTRVHRCAACASGRVYGGATACVDCGAAARSEHPADGDDEAMLAALTAPGRPSELVQRLLAHPQLAPEDVRVWLTMLELLPALAPAPALAGKLRAAARAAAERMPYISVAEHGALAGDT